MSLESSAPRRRRWWLVVLLSVGVPVILAIPVAEFLITQAIGRVTVVTDADGSERTVYWRDYPGIAELDPHDVLAGPTVEEGYSEGAAMVAEIRDALTAELALEWVGDARTEKDFDPFQEDVQNWFGGPSMLTNINAPSWQSTTVPESWADKRRAVEIIAEVTARYGYSAPTIADEETLGGPDGSSGATPESRIMVSGMVLGPVGQWLSFAFQDFSQDPDGRFAEKREATIEDGLEPNSIILGYGANGLLPEADRQEFERRLEPFVGLTPPPPLET